MVAQSREKFFVNSKITRKMVRKGRNNKKKGKYMKKGG